MGWNIWPLCYAIDIRSLAAFRILLGLYFLYDIYSRLSLGKYDLAWYTQGDRSYLDPSDTPHKSPIHAIWFYRGSETMQKILFGVTTVVTLCFCLGLYCRGPLKIAMFVLVTSMQNRCMSVSDGSDSFSRHLLLWSCFLPMSDYWSLDASWNLCFRETSAASTTVRGLAPLALRMQILFMYWGTVANRTIDGWRSPHPWSTVAGYQSEWLPPRLTAVHYAVSGAFATRNHALAQWVRSTASVSKAMTAGAMLVEVLAPLGCFLAPNDLILMVCAFLMWALHAGMLALLNLPTWQLMGMLTQVVWIPSSVWERVLGSSRAKPIDDTAIYKKTDRPASTASSPLPALQPTRFSLQGNLASRLLKYFFFAYMIYNWLGNRGWIPKHDHGDIGEGLRISQYWVMYGEVSHSAENTFLTGVSRNGKEKIDLYHYLKTGEFQPQQPLGLVPHDMSSRYPSHRWERALAQWAVDYSNSQIRGRKFCKAICKFVNEDRKADKLPAFALIELRFQHRAILPPGRGSRYAESALFPDTVIRTPCSS